MATNKEAKARYQFLAKCKSELCAKADWTKQDHNAWLSIKPQMAWLEENFDLT